MPPDQLPGRRPSRRRFLHISLAIGAALMLPQPAAAASIAVMKGEVYVNGRRATRETPIRAGDAVRTGAGATFSFMLGADAFMLRPMTSIVLEAQPDSLLISGLRVISGALAAVFGPGTRSVKTSLVTAAIRGTGIYIEIAAESTYFCNCYGDVGLTVAAGAKKDVVSTNHAAHFIHARPSAAGTIVAAPMMNHSNQELAMLEKLVGRTPRLKP